jgi:hypothetical protein
MTSESCCGGGVWLVAPAGRFAVSQLTLAAGGRLRVTVSLHGRLLNAAKCALAIASPNHVDPLHAYLAKWESATDVHGVCRSVALPEGAYRLAVRPPDGGSDAYRSVRIVEGAETEEDVALAPARLSGVVRRGGKPAPGYTVRAMASPDGESSADIGTAAEAAADSEGAYEMTLWTAGKYSLWLEAPSKTGFGVHGTVEVREDDDKKQDFDLDASSLRGQVVDQNGSPLASAMVLLLWQRTSPSSAITDAQGQFEIDLQGTGSGTVTARKSGYGKSNPVPVQLDDEDSGLPPLTLVLTRQSTVKGTVVSAAGAPVARALVVSAAPGARDTAGYTRADDGGNFEVAVPGGAARLFLSGPGCPMFALDLQPQDADAPPTAVASSGGGNPGDPGDPGTADGAGDAGGSAAGGAAGQVWQCPGEAGAIAVTFTDESGKPAAPLVTVFFLRRDGMVVPSLFLLQHLALLGLPSRVDSSGQLLLGGLSPGQYDLVLSGMSPEGAAAGSVAVGPGGTSTLKLTLPARYLRRQ